MQKVNMKIWYVFGDPLMTGICNYVKEMEKMLWVPQIVKTQLEILLFKNQK